MTDGTSMLSLDVSNVSLSESKLLEKSRLADKKLEMLKKQISVLESKKKL